MPRPEALLALLADGRFHSGAALGRALGVGKGAIWKQTRSLGALGVEVFAVRGKGYRLAAPLELLNRDRILAGLEATARLRLAALEVHGQVESTNLLLAVRAPAAYRGPVACLAEGQTAGRGRRGRRWASPYGRNLYLSLLWRFDRPGGALQSLGLALGVAVADALVLAGASGVGLKWPNDLVWNDRKLGGILVQMSGAPEGPWDVVAGVGVNVDMSAGAAREVDQPWTDLRRAAGAPVSRNALAARLVSHLVECCARFEGEGFAPFRRRYDALDAVRGRDVTVQLAEGRSVGGRARGVDEDGALMLEGEGGVSRILGGDVSLRLSA